MKFLLLFLLGLVAGQPCLIAQPPAILLQSDGITLLTKTNPGSPDTAHLSCATLKKVKWFTISFRTSKPGPLKRSAWLQNENVTDPEQYTYRLPGTAGTITIHGSTMRSLLKGTNTVAIWTSLQPVNQNSMIRVTRQLICTLMID
ncbi:MAG: hypothetical protein ABIX01_07305 [Chitinophagaceae bacterium]